MMLSEAAGIITAYGGATTLAVYGTTFIAAGGNAFGILVALGLPSQRAATAELAAAGVADG